MVALTWSEIPAILLPQEQPYRTMDTDVQIVLFQVSCPFINDADVSCTSLLLLQAETEDTDLTIMQPWVTLRQPVETGRIVYWYYVKFSVGCELP